MTQDATYLKMTINDNDYTNALRIVGEYIQGVFKFMGAYPTKEEFSEEDLPFLKRTIMNIWHSTECMMDLLKHRGYVERDTEYFYPRLEFVSFKDIPENDNLEGVYVPMFDGEILVR